MKFLKMEHNWWKINEEENLKQAWISNVNGGFKKNVDVTGLSFVEAKGWKELDWQNTIYWDNSYKTGLLAPNGKFYGCDHECHELQAQLVHKKEEDDLEREGYIKFTHLNEGDKEVWAFFSADEYDRNRRPTKEQLNYLAKRQDCNLTGITCFEDNTLEQ